MKKLIPRFLSVLLVAAVLFFIIYGLAASETVRLVALIFGILCAVLLVLKVVNYFAYLLPRRAASWIHWIHAMVFESFGFVIMLCLRPIGYLWKLKAGSGRGEPILLVHGYIHDSSAWVYLKRKLLRKGFGPIYMVNFHHPFLSIMEYVKQVAEKADEIEKETGRKDLILIGHSMGGIISCYYATKVAPPNKVTDVITIASPLGGTVLARVGIGADAREMERDAELLKDLQEAVRQHKEIRFFHVVSKTDEIVIPFSSEYVSDSHGRRFVVDDIGHISVLYSYRVADKIISWLRGD